MATRVPRPLDLNSHHAVEILPKVGHENAGLRLSDGHRPQRLDHPHRFQHLSDDSPAGCGNRLNRLPRGIVEAGPVPAGLFQSSVVFLAVEFVVRPDRTLVGNFPFSIAYDELRSSILVFDPHLKQQFWVTEGRSLGRHVQTRRVESAIAKDNADGIATAAEMLGHVEGDVHRPLVITRLRRIHHLVADPAAVEIQLGEAQPAHGNRGTGHFLRNVELPPQHPGRQAAMIVGRGRLAAVEPDPFRFPIFRLEQSHRPAGRLAPAGGLAVLVPNSGLPATVSFRFQRSTGILDLNRPIGFDLPGIPEVAAVLGKYFRRGGNQDLIGRLPQAAFGRPFGLQYPTQPRMQLVDAERVDKVLAS